MPEEKVDRIRELLIEDELTMQQIATEVGATRMTVNNWAKRFGLMKQGPRNDVKTKAASNS